MVHWEFLWNLWYENWRSWMGRLCILVMSKNVFPERHSSESSKKPIRAKYNSWFFQVCKGNLCTNGSKIWWRKQMEALICLIWEHTIKDKETQQDVSPRMSASATLFIIDMNVVYLLLPIYQICSSFLLSLKRIKSHTKTPWTFGSCMTPSNIHS